MEIFFPFIDRSQFVITLRYYHFCGFLALCYLSVHGKFLYKKPNDTFLNMESIHEKIQM